jgi:hypothetical protein
MADGQEFRRTRIMKIGRWLTVIIGATLGSLFAVWWIRNRGLPALPSGLTARDGMDSGESSDWLTLS